MNADFDANPAIPPAITPAVREEQHGYLLRLSDALRPLTDADEIKVAATRFLGEELDVNRAFYAETDNDHWLVTKGYEKGIEPLPDLPFAMATFGQWSIDDFRAGRRLVVRDMSTDSRFHESERATQQGSQIVASVAVPLVKDGALVATLVVHSIASRDWTEHALALVDETAERTWAAVERARADLALCESEDRYRSLFDAASQGFAINQLVRDKGGRVIDAHYLDLNPAYETQTGFARTAAIGRLASEIFPQIEPFWLEMAERVVETGQPERAENFLADTGSWFSFNMGRLEGRDRFAVVYDDITARKSAENSLRESEERQAFLLNLSDALRPLADATGVQAKATRMLREQLEAGWCYYVEFDETGTVARALRDSVKGDLPSLVGVHDLSDVPEFTEYLRSGGLLNASELATYPLFNTRIAEQYASLGMQSALAAPLVKGGQLLALLVVADTSPRDWPESAATLVVEVAERTWAAVERSRAEAAMRASEAWLAAQNEALQAVVDGAPLKESLNILSRAAIEAIGDACRCAFFMLDPELDELHHMAGMPEAYGSLVDAISIAPDSFGCGLALYTREPVITPDVRRSRNGEIGCRSRRNMASARPGRFRSKQPVTKRSARWPYISPSRARRNHATWRSWQE